MVLQSLLQTVSLVSGVTEQLILNPYDAVAISFFESSPSPAENKKGPSPPLPTQLNITISITTNINTHVNVNLQRQTLKYNYTETTGKFHGRASDRGFSLVSFT